MTSASTTSSIVRSTVGSCDISYLSPNDLARWDRYVERHPDGTFFHLSGWGEAIRNAYGYEPLYLAAWREGELVGLVLLIDVRSPLLGRALISTGFTIGGGPIGDDSEVVEALALAAASEGTARNVQYVEFRSDVAPLTGWEVKTDKYVNFKIPIAADKVENLKTIAKRRRAEIRKAVEAEKAGDLRVRVEIDPDAFYALYAKSLKALGTPIFPKRFIHELIQNFGDATEISFIDYRGETVSALLSFYFKDSVLPYYIGASPMAREARATDYICWSQMRRAADRGIAFLDFGRSKIGSGSYAYKKHWGAKPEPISYHYKLIAARSTPDINPNNPKFKYFSKAWTHLPLPVANALGPILAPNFP